MPLSSLSRFVPGVQQVFLNRFIQVLTREMIPLEIVGPNGSTWITAGENVRHRLMIRDNRFFGALASPNAFSLGEAYIKGYFDISGNIKELYEMCAAKLLGTEQPRRISALFTRFWERVCSLQRDREKKNISYHYDVPKEFFRIFLGETMGYTCGYYPQTDTTMTQAQNEKMAIVCRKLRLTPQDHLLDIGCGWGNFLVYAARQCGVRATGITLSREQLEYALAWVEAEGLADRVDIKLLNYRDLPEGRFDKISCIGMSEHVGEANMAEFYRTVFRCLKPCGLFLQHTITTNMKRKKGHANRFLDTYMFPGGELLRQPDLVDLAAGEGFELLGAENFRTHYVRTLADWISRMETHRERLRSLVTEQVFRIYHVFFIGSLISFRRNEIALFQNLFLKPGDYLESQPYFLTPYDDEEILPKHRCL